MKQRIILHILLLITLLGFTISVSAQESVTKSGTTAAEFLSIPVGARAVSLGNAVTALNNGVTSIYWNPAGIANLKSGAISLDYATWLNQIDFGYAGVVLPFSFGNIGVGITSFRTPDIEVTTVEQQEGTGETYNASSYAINLAYAKALTDRFSIGGTVKIIQERIAHSNASGFAFDIGTLFITPFKGIRLGASITNFGSKLSLSGDDLLIVVDVDPNNGGNNISNKAFLQTDEFELPLTMRIGLAGEIVQTDQVRATLAIDAISPNNASQHVNIGLEVALLGDLVALRGGYNELFIPKEDQVRGLTLGAGLHYAFGPLDMTFDYAFQTFKYFSAINRLSFAMKF